MFSVNVNILIDNDIDIIEVLKSFLYAMTLDIATACYLIAIPIILLLLQSIYPSKTISKINNVYMLLLIAIYTFLTIGEIGLYPEWETKMGYRALLYFKRPDEIMRTMTLFQVIAAITLFVSIVILFFWLFRKWFYRPIESKYKYSYILSPLFLIVSMPLLVLGARGGFNPIPISASEVYFSRYPFVNATTVNNLFSITVSIIENVSLDQNAFTFYPNQEAEQRVKQLYTPHKDTVIDILSTTKPNVVLILLESWSADLVESLGGDSRITPNFRQLEKEGILFTNIYSNGRRSEQGMSSTFGGFPSISFTNIVSQPEKSSKLPSFIKAMNKQNYYTSFNFGGELRYGNIKGYIIDNGFQQVKENRDFSDKIPRGRLGIHDHYLYDEVVSQLESTQQPFFTSIYTLSSHNPYDQPQIVSIPEWNLDEEQYIQSAHYADYALGRFIDSVKTSSWYANTIFILIADHSHRSYKQYDWESPESHKIPLLIFGKPIKEELKGTKITTIGTNSDLAPTLMSIIDLPSAQFEFSKNLLNPTTKQFAYYSLDHGGYVWITPQGYFAWNSKYKNYTNIKIHDAIKDSVMIDANSFIQTAFRKYVNY